MMMKLTVAFLATLAAADAAQSHGRRHIRRADYSYGNGYGHGSESSGLSALPVGTGSSAVVDTAAPTEVPSLTGGFEYPTGPAGGPSGSVDVPGTSGSVVVPDPATAVVDSTLIAFPSTGIPVPYPTGSGVSFPSTGIANTGTPDEGQYVVTSTIYSTQTFTLTVTIPGEADTTKLVTSVVPIATAIITKTSGVPDTTEVPVLSAPISEIVHVITETLTYTVGVGSTAHPVTTEIVQTSTETIYQTIVVTVPAAEPTVVGSEDAVVSEGPSGTTTVLSTSTTTKVITVYPVPAGSSGASVALPISTGPAGECNPPVTQTVTVKETVTVTAGQEVPATTAKPDATNSAIDDLSSVSLSSVPYPLGNSTTVIPASTGFLTATKPAETVIPAPYPTGTAPAVPTDTAPVGTAVPGTSGLPSFALPSELAVPSSTALPAESVPAQSSIVEPSAAATPSDYSYSPYGSYAKNRRSNV